MGALRASHLYFHHCTYHVFPVVVSHHRRQPMISGVARHGGNDPEDGAQGEQRARRALGDTHPATGTLGAAPPILCI